MSRLLVRSAVHIGGEGKLSLVLAEIDTCIRSNSDSDHHHDHRVVVVLLNPRISATQCKSHRCSNNFVFEGIDPAVNSTQVQALGSCSLVIWWKLVASIEMQPQPVHLCTADQKKRVLNECQAAKDQLERGCQRKSRVLFFFFVVHTHRCGSSSINANFCDATSSCFTHGEEEEEESEKKCHYYVVLSN